MSFYLRGIVSAIVTPMNSDESINLIEFQRQLDRQINAGVAAIFCLGTNGEFYSLTSQEKKLIMQSAVEHVAKRVPVIAGVGEITTSAAKEQIDNAYQAKCDAVSVLTPYFAQLTQKDALNHYTELADYSKIPVIIYNIPARTGFNMDVKTLKALSAHPNIVGVKDSSGNFDNILKYIESTPKDFMVLSGNDQLILWTLKAGGCGGISGVTNILPDTMVKIFTLFEQGEFEKAFEVQCSIREIRNTFTLYNPNSIVKRATVLMGQNVGNARAPFNLIDDEIDNKIKKALAKYEL